MNSTPKVTVLVSLFNCEKYLEPFLGHVANIENSSQTEVLLLHNQPKPEEIKIIEHKIVNLPFVKHIVIPERESLYKTWNRGISLAKGEYLCIWNVDDIRRSDSIKAQAETLDQNPEASLTYGDFYYMYKYGESSEILVSNPDFKEGKKTFFRFHHIGCFPMWRKTIHEKFGYFDEQLRLVADFDFQIRLSLKTVLVKTNTMLGYYLEDDPGKLSSNYSLQTLEKNLVYLRYGIYDFVNWFYIPKTYLTYKIRKFKYKETYTQIEIPAYFLTKRLPLLFISIFRQPRFFLAYIKHGILKK